MKINKTIIFIISIFFFSFLNISSVFSAESCKYSGEIDQCIKANEDGSTKSIEDFVCITGTDEEIIYQIVLDQEFKNLDEEMDKYIEDLEKNKNVYFGKNRQKTYIDGINDIEYKKKYFEKEYLNLCSIGIIKESASCIKDGITSINNAKRFFSSYGTPCKNLVNKKMSIFDDISFGVLMFNKQQIKADEKKTYDQGQRKKYNRLIDIMMINLGYLERLWQKWPSKLANPHQ